MGEQTISQLVLALRRAAKRLAASGGRVSRRNARREFTGVVQDMEAYMDQYPAIALPAKPRRARKAPEQIVLQLKRQGWVVLASVALVADLSTHGLPVRRIKFAHKLDHTTASTICWLTPGWVKYLVDQNTSWAQIRVISRSPQKIRATKAAMALTSMASIP